MLSSRARPRTASFLLALAGLLFLALGLAACSSGGKKKQPSQQAKSAAYAPTMGDSDLIVPEGHALPPELANARGRGARARRVQAPPVDPARQAPPTRALSPAPEFRATGPQIRVTWEALAVERARHANSRFGGQRRMGGASQLKAVVVSESHIEAQTSMRGLQSRRNRGVAVASIPDQDIQAFVQGLRQQGFFRLARPTSSVAHMLRDENARGHITVEQGGESYTLISMRGQGLHPATKQIPAIYSEAKQSILMLRNSRSTMSVVGVSGGVLTK